MDSRKRIIVIGSDHAGYKLKQILKSYLEEKNQFTIVDVGTDSSESCDFPDYAIKLCNKVLEDKETRGIVVCGSGIGVSITANKFPGIRCALVHDHLTAKLAIQHTNCNVIAIGESIVGSMQAKDIVDSYFSHEFINEEKYQRRINKITELENKFNSKDQ
jgi:ribose 5-phosphate isomerase B